MKKIISLVLTLCFIAIMPAMAEAEKVELNATTNQTIQQTENIQNLSDYIDVTRSQLQLNSRLRSVYTGYQYTVVSKYKNPLNLMNGSIINGINGQQGYLNVEKSSAAAIGTALGSGFVLGIVSLGITFLVAIVASPFIYASNNGANKKARNEGMAYSNQIPMGVLNTGDSMIFTTLIPIGQQPQIKLTFIDLKNKEIYSISR